MDSDIGKSSRKHNVTPRPEHGNKKGRAPDPPRVTTAGTNNGTGAPPTPPLDTMVNKKGKPGEANAPGTKTHDATTRVNARIGGGKPRTTRKRTETRPRLRGDRS